MINVNLVLLENRAEVHIVYQGMHLDMTPDEALGVAQMLVMCANMAKQGDPPTLPPLH